jgi:hypothetical protein
MMMEKKRLFILSMYPTFWRKRFFRDGQDVVMRWRRAEKKSVLECLPVFAFSNIEAYNRSEKTKIGKRPMFLPENT